jgi:hypothetical protein
MEVITMYKNKKAAISELLERRKTEKKTTAPEPKEIPIDAIRNRIKIEYTDRRFKETFSEYPVLSEPYKSINVKPWTLPRSLLDKNGLTREQIQEDYTAIFKNKEIKSPSRFDRSYMEIDFTLRIQQCGSERSGISHSIASITHVEDVPYRFRFPKDDLPDVKVLAGNGCEGKRAYLYIRLKDGMKRVFELGDFCLLSVSYIDDWEMGTFSLFNKRLGILYSEMFEIAPDFKQTCFSPIKILQDYDERKKMTPPSLHKPEPEFSFV